MCDCLSYFVEYAFSNVAVGIVVADVVVVAVVVVVVVVVVTVNGRHDDRAVLSIIVSSVIEK